MGWRNWWSQWSDKLFGSKPNQSGRRSRRERDRRFRPQLEPLEVRNLLTAVPQLMADVYHVGTQNSNPGDFVDVAGTTYFTADDGVHGRELWKTDGTSAGTSLVADVKFAGDSNPRQLTNVNGTLFFVVDDPYGTGQVLCRTSNGTNSTVNAVMAATHFTSLTNYNGSLYFAADNGTSSGIWRTENTSQLPPVLLGGSQAAVPDSRVFDGSQWGTGTLRPGNYIVDLNPPSTVLPPGLFVTSPLTAYQGKLYFLTGQSDANLGFDTTRPNAALWSTDGTSAGTTMVRSFNVQVIGNELVVANNQLLFRAGNDYDAELWSSNGTSAGTHLVRNINVDRSSNPSSFVVMGNRVIFAANDGVHGSELWSSDGTSTGTTMLADIYAGANAGVRGPLLSDYWTEYVGAGVYGTPKFVVANGLAYFTARITDWNSELWQTDGTAAGTIKSNLNASLDSLTVVAGDLYFSNVDDMGRPQLNRLSSGQATPTVIDSSQSGSQPVGYSSLTNVNGRLFFARSDNVAGTEVWSTNGTSAGTGMIRDINVIGRSSNPSRIIDTIQGRTIFVASDENGEALWSSDGTPGGLVRLSPSPLPPGSLIALSDAPVKDGTFFRSGDVLYYLVSDNSSLGSGYAIFRTDGTAAGSYKLLEGVAQQAGVVTASIPPGGWSGPDINPQFIEVNGAVYFQARDNEGAVRLWKTDGTVAGTVAFFTPLQIWESPLNSFATINGKLYFSLRGPALTSTPPSLWESDGTSTGTRMVSEVPGMSYGAQMHVFGGKLYFGNSNSATGRELWTSDGTSSGTHLVRDINLGAANSDVSVVGNKNGYLYFTANDGQHGQELWRTDGTSSGTTLVVDLTPGSASSSGKFTSVGDGWVYSDTLASVGDVHSRMVWIEEHSGGPVSLFEVPQAVKWEQITNITRVGSKIVFYALEPNQQSINYPLVTLDSLVGQSSPALPIASTVIERQWKLYVSDGTAAGTYAFATKPYNADENLELAVDGSRVYFVQNGNTTHDNWVTLGFFYSVSSGTEVWMFDTDLPVVLAILDNNGTFNPQPISDIGPGLGSSFPSHLTVIDGKLYFSAADPLYGRELFSYTPAPPPPSVSLEVDRSQINENGGTATVRVVLSATQSQDVIVTLGDIFNSSSDYQLSATTISIPAGQLSGSVLLSAINDSISEPSETATVRILSVSQGVSIARSAASVQILDDDRFVLNQGTLTITGDAGANVVKLVHHNNTATFEVTIDGEVRTFNIADVSRIVLDGATGDDSLEFFGNQYSGEHLAFTPSGFTGTSDATQLSAAGFETITVQGSYLDPPLANSIYPAILIGDTLSFIGGSGVDVFRQTSTGISASGRGYSYQIVDSNWGVSAQLLGTEDVHIVGDRVQFSLGFVTVTGTTGNDQITIDRSNSSVLVVTVNGETSTIAVSALATGIFNLRVNVSVDGLAGNDIYTVIGSSVVTEYVSMGSTGVFYSGGTVSINANNVENSTFNGQSQDTANFFGSSGDDTFRGFSTYASLIGTGYVVLANRCGMVYAGQGGGGKDVALLYDTIGDDTFTIEKHSEMSAPASFPQGTIVDPDVINLVSMVTSPVNYSLAVLQGAGYRHQVVGFGKTYAFASGGNDTATFKTARNLSTGLPPFAPQVAPSAFFYGLAPYSVLVDGSLVMQATGFDHVSADATDAFASSIMYDSPGNDTYIGELYHSSLSGPGYSIDSRGFRYNYAIRGSGGADTAVLQDSALHDTLLVYPGTTTLHFGVAGFQQLIAFPDVTANSNGNDSAYFFDSAGNDQFQISGRESRFTYGSGDSLRARLFDFVYASSSGGGNDIRSGESPSWLQYVGSWRDQTTSSSGGSSGGGSTTPSRTPFRFGRSGSA